MSAVQLTKHADAGSTVTANGNAETLLHHHALHRLDTFVPEPYPSAIPSNNQVGASPSSTPEAATLSVDQDPQQFESAPGIAQGLDGIDEDIEQSSTDNDTDHPPALDQPAKPQRNTVVVFTGMDAFKEEDEAEQHEQGTSAASNRTSLVAPDVSFSCISAALQLVIACTVQPLS